MNRIIVMALAVILAFSSGAALAASGVYAGGKMAATGVFGDDIDWGNGQKSDGKFFSLGFGPVAGYDFRVKGGPRLRVEAEMLFRTGEEWTKNVSSAFGTMQLKTEIEWMATILSNIWYDIAVIPAGNITIKPFVGGSLGFGVVSYELEASLGGNSVSEDGRDVAIIAGPGAGVRFDINEKIALDTTLRYLLSTKYDIEGEKYNAPMLDCNIGIVCKF